LDDQGTHKLGIHNSTGKCFYFLSASTSNNVASLSARNVPVGIMQNSSRQFYQEMHASRLLEVSFCNFKSGAHIRTSAMKWPYHYRKDLKALFQRRSYFGPYVWADPDVPWRHEEGVALDQLSGSGKPLITSPEV
jgi:hypothetical protein